MESDRWSDKAAHVVSEAITNPLREAKPPSH
jgi:hypothetical protein